MAVDAAGNKSASAQYSPWGETRSSSGSLPTNFQYTGQRNEAALGLYYYGARWYIAYLNRIIFLPIGGINLLGVE